MASDPTEIHFKNLSQAQRDELLPKNLLCVGFRGSIAHGMYTPSSDPSAIDDKDIMGAFIGPMEQYLGFGRDDVHERFIGEWDAVSYELRKLFSLLLKGNPNVLSLLWLDPKHIIYAHPLWKRVIDAREFFVSKAVYQSFTGYAYGQMKKMTAFGEKERDLIANIEEALTRRDINLEYAASAELQDVSPATAPASTYVPGTPMEQLVVMNNRDLISHYQKTRRKFFAGYMGEKRKGLVVKHGYDTKNAAHCIRLLRMSVEFLTEGQLFVERRDAQELLAIKRGEWSVEQVQAEAKRLFNLADEAYVRCALPSQPKKDDAEQLLVQTIREYHSV